MKTTAGRAIERDSVFRRDSLLLGAHKVQNRPNTLMLLAFLAATALAACSDGDDSRQSRGADSAAASSSAGSEQVNRLERVLDLVSGEVERLRDRQNRLEKRLTAMQQVQNELLAQRPSTGTAQGARPRHKEQEIALKRLVQSPTVSTAPDQEPRRAFEHDAPRDPRQQQALTETVIDALAQAGLSGVDLLDAECRETTCRLVMDRAGNGADELFELEIAGALATAFGAPVDISYEDAEDSGQILYIRRLAE
jgi:TolA-binding protein